MRFPVIEQADAVAFLDTLPADSVDLVFCSPPYCDARLYLESGEDIGIARGADEWVAWMLTVCRAASRVCKGLCAFVVEGRTTDYCYDCTPFILLADLHREGFNLRKPVVYRRVGIPGSGGPDWLRNDWELIVCFTRPGRLPWSDQTACGKPPKYAPGGEMSNRLRSGERVNQWGMRIRKDDSLTATEPTKNKLVKRSTKPSHRVMKIGEGGYGPPVLANPGNVIDCLAGGGHMGNSLATENEAPFPESLASFFILSFCPPGGIVCDPFSGSGTTAAVAFRTGRCALACDLRASQVELSRRRIAAETPCLPGIFA